MKLVAFALLGFWALALLSFAGLAARTLPLPGSLLGLAAFTPDVGTLLLVTFASRLERGDARAAAFVVAMARAALGADSPLALLAAAWATAEACAFVRTQLTLDGRVVRAVLCGVLAGAHAAFLSWCAAVRAPTPVSPERDVVDYALPAALATLLLALVVGAALRHLPGLSALWRTEAAWQHAEPAR